MFIPSFLVCKEIEKLPDFPKGTFYTAMYFPDSMFFAKFITIEIFSSLSQRVGIFFS